MTAIDPDLYAALEQAAKRLVDLDLKSKNLSRPSFQPHGAVGFDRHGNDEGRERLSPVPALNRGSSSVGPDPTPGQSP